MKKIRTKMTVILAFAAFMVLMTGFSAFAEKTGREEQQAYRTEASGIRGETREINAEIKEVNAQIRELRTAFQEIRKTYRKEKQLPEGVSASDWEKALELQSEIKALNQAGKTAGNAAAADPEDGETEAAADETAEEREEPTVRELAAEGRFDEALKELKAKQNTRKDKLAQRQEILKRWKRIAELIG